MLLQTADNPRLLRGFGEDVTSVLHGAALRGEDADIRPLFRPRSHSPLTPCLAATAASAIKTDRGGRVLADGLAAHLVALTLSKPLDD